MFSFSKTTICSYITIPFIFINFTVKDDKETTETSRGTDFQTERLTKISPDALALHVLPFGNNLLEGLEMVLTYLVHSNHQCVYPGKHPQEHQVELK